MSVNEKQLDVAAIRAEARRDWERHVKRRLTVQERIGDSVPWWLVIIAGMFFALSAPHTARVSDMLDADPVGVVEQVRALLSASVVRRVA